MSGLASLVDPKAALDAAGRMVEMRGVRRRVVQGDAPKKRKRKIPRRPGTFTEKAIAAVLANPAEARKAIAREIGCSPSTVATATQLLFAEKKGQRAVVLAARADQRKERAEQVLKLLTDDPLMRVDAIAAELGVSLSTTWDVLQSLTSSGRLKVSTVTRREVVALAASASQENRNHG